MLPPPAKEARIIAQRVIDQANTEELNKLAERIKYAAANGNFSISCEGSLSAITKNKLKELGYKVIYANKGEIGLPCNDACYSISWREEYK